MNFSACSGHLCVTIFLVRRPACPMGMLSARQAGQRNNFRYQTDQMNQQSILQQDLIMPLPAQSVLLGAHGRLLPSSVILLTSCVILLPSSVILLASCGLLLLSSVILLPSSVILMPSSGLRMVILGILLKFNNFQLPSLYLWRFLRHGVLSKSGFLNRVLAVCWVQYAPISRWRTIKTGKDAGNSDDV